MTRRVFRMPRMRDLAIDLAAFVATVALAVICHWEARDVIWGLWASSLVVGYTTILVGAGKMVVSGPPWSWLPMSFVGLFVIAFFTVHFGGFHLGHAVFLNIFFPISADCCDELSSIPRMALLALQTYWPMAAMSLLSRLRDFRGPVGFVRPYINVIRMHLLIFVFAGLNAMDLSRFAIYPVLVFYFFPWGTLFPKQESAEPAAATVETTRAP